MAKRGALYPASQSSKRHGVETGMTVTRFCETARDPPSNLVSVAGCFQFGERVRGRPRPRMGSRPTPRRLPRLGMGGGIAKLADLKRVGIDDVEAGPVSDSTMYRVLARNGLSLPANHTSEVRQLAGVRREAFIDPPARRNRLWQADFSEFETLAAGTWNLGGVVDYRAKVNLACAVTVTKITRDAVAFFEAALIEVETLLGMSWIRGPHRPGHQ